MRRVAAALAAVLLLAAVAPAAALAAGCPRTTVPDLEDEVMCPVCQTTLALARDAPLAKRERAFIAQLVRQCRSKAEIKQALVGQFGPAVLALPQARGFDVSVYALPLAAGVAALAGVAFMLIGWRRRSGRGTANPAPARTHAEERLLEAQLERLR